MTLKELSTFNVTNLPLSTVASAFNTVLWLLLVSFPFIQVSKQLSYLLGYTYICKCVESQFQLEILLLGGGGGGGGG